MIRFFGDGEQSNVFAVVGFDSVEFFENVFFAVFVNNAYYIGLEIFFVHAEITVLFQSGYILTLNFVLVNRK